MSKYDEMSDHELSSLLLSIKVLALGYKANIRPSIPHDGGASNAYCGNTLENFDINNPADMWPIIFDNKIEICWFSGDKWRAIIDNQCQPREYKKFTCLDKNPLRAAAIVFLMMHEV